jgi:hypothetical protein
MSPDVSAGKPRSPEQQPQKPRIVVHGTAVDFGDVRFFVDVYSDYTVSSISVIDARERHLTQRQQDALIENTMPWIDRVLDYDPIGPWGEARFRPEGMEFIDEVQETRYWTFPSGGGFRPDVLLPASWTNPISGRPNIPEELKMEVYDGDVDAISMSLILGAGRRNKKSG